MTLKEHIKLKAPWFLLGFVIIFFPYANVLGENKGFQEKNKMLMGILCSMPKKELTEKVNELELPSDIQESLGDKVAEATQNFRENLLKECE